MKFTLPFSTARSQVASPSSSTTSFPSTTTTSASNSEYRSSSPDYFDTNRSFLSAGSYSQYTYRGRAMQPPNPFLHYQARSRRSSRQPFDEAQLRNHARAMAVQELKVKAVSTFWHLQAEEKALSGLHTRLTRALCAATEAWELGEEDLVPVSMEWAIEKVEKRLVVQEEMDVTEALLDEKKLCVEAIKNEMERLKMALMDLGEWNGVQAEIKGRIERELECEDMGEDGEDELMDYALSTPSSVSAELEELPPLVRMNGISFRSAVVCESRPPLAGRHTAVP